MLLISDIQNFFNHLDDFPSVILLILMGMSCFVAVVTLIEKVFAILGKPIGAMKQRKEDHELLMNAIQDLAELHNTHEKDTKNSIKQDELIRNDLHNLTITVNEIGKQINTMQKKIDNTEMAKLKEKLLSYYRKYKDIGEWEKFEADVFWGLYDSYISHGGNSFVKHTIEPVMRELKIKD